MGFAILLRSVTAAAMLALPCADALAQAYPSHATRIIVTNPPGGTVDILARTAADELAKAFGQPFVVENRPGANGNIGADLLAKSAPDGYTLMVGPPGPFAINPSLFANLSYNPATDLAPVTLLAVAPLVLVVNPGVPANNLQELLAWMKKEGSPSYASQGPASTGQLAMELLKAMAGVNATHVPYKGSAPAITDLIAGHVKLAFDNTTSSRPPVRRGALRAIAVAEKKRLAAVPADSRSCRTCRRCARRAFPISIRSPGSASSPPAARRARSCKKSRRMSRRCFRMRNSASAI